MRAVPILPETEWTPITAEILIQKLQELSPEERKYEVTFLLSPFSYVPCDKLFTDKENKKVILG